MNVGFTEEQEELRGLVRRLMEDRSSSEDIRAHLGPENGHDEQLWKLMAEQLGLQGIAIAEDLGGSGCGGVELGIVLEEMGRALYTGPFFSTVVLAAQLLDLSGDEEAQAAWLPSIADGSLTATVGWDGTSSAPMATGSADGWRLHGVLDRVIDGATADLLLVVAATAEGPGLFAVDTRSTEVSRTSLDALDLTRGLGRIEFTDTPAQPFAQNADVRALIRRLKTVAAALISNEQAGGAARALEMAVDYAKIREQFGRPIGSFQAIKHKCADMLLKVECSRSAAYSAAALINGESSEFATAAALAKAYCSEAYTFVAKENIQIHGGIGFTWEHDAHLHLRRAKSSEILLGSPGQHRRELAKLVGIG